MGRPTLLTVYRLLVQRVTNVQLRRRLRSSSSSTLIVPVTRRATLNDRSFRVAATQAWMERPMGLCHGSAYRRIVLCRSEDVSLLTDFLTPTRHVTLLCNVFLKRCASLHHLRFFFARGLTARFNIICSFNVKIPNVSEIFVSCKTMGSEIAVQLGK